jgi:RNA polymerase sigma factor (sigma-70 family)
MTPSVAPPPGLQSLLVTREEAARLVREARAGNADAWAQLVGAYERLVLAIAFNFRLGRADAEDVLQTVFFRLAQHLDRIRDPASVGSWVASVARNECVALVRRPQEVSIIDAIDDFGTVASPEEAVIAGERSVELWKAFGALSPECQALLTLLVLTEPQPSYEDISVALDVPIGSIGPTRRRCLDRLKHALDRT